MEVNEEFDARSDSYRIVQLKKYTLIKKEY